MQTININLDSGRIRPIIEAFEPFSYNQDFTINLEHHPKNRIMVDKYPLLCSIVNEIKKQGNQCYVNLNYQGVSNQLDYAERMGFLSFLGIDYPYKKVKRNNGGRFIEVKNVNGYYFPDQELEEIFQNDFGLTENQAKDFSVIISEVAINSHLHSESKGGAILYCQKYPNQKLLNLFIIDSGIGFYRAMRLLDKYKILNEREVFLKAFEFGEGNGKGYGQGLFLVSEFIRRNLGTLRVISGNFMHIIQEKKSFIFKIPTRYDGVITHLGIPFDINSTISEIMDEQIIE